MKLSIPCTWDDELLNFLETMGKQSRKYDVFEVFGSMRISAIGTGRGADALMGKCLRRNDVESFVQKIHHAGLGFNYTINASCLGNAEYSYRKRKAIIDELEWILSFSDSVTVAVPYLIDLVRQIAGNKVEIVCSILAQVETSRKLEHFARLGVNRVVLSLSLNRDLRRIAAMKKASPVSLEILVNDNCLYECPFRLMHYNENSHASRLKDNLFYPDYCLTKCMMERLNNPEELLKSRWIRPEDLRLYESMIDVVKISGRGKKTRWVCTTIKAYASGMYSGNIFDLLTLVPLQSNTSGASRSDDEIPFHISNEALDKYMARFYTGDNVCIDCGTCNYCKLFADEHMSADADAVASIKKKLESKIQPLLHIGGIPLFLKETVVRIAYVSYVKNGMIWQLLHQGGRFIKGIGLDIFLRRRKIKMCKDNGGRDND
jgi:collagenase-like PrtC family protease